MISRSTKLQYCEDPNTGQLRFLSDKTCLIVRWFGIQMASENQTMYVNLSKSRIVYLLIVKEKLDNYGIST